ncbi:hypothetical protein PENSPDRAFT_667109 [Peniophora sp. CONT]|nr:hypothetical protein PENSPDRAFT_667109 [Peniophora sp. CONT]
MFHTAHTVSPLLGVQHRVSDAAGIFRPSQNDFSFAPHPMSAPATTYPFLINGAACGGILREHKELRSSVVVGYDQYSYTPGQQSPPQLDLFWLDKNRFIPCSELVWRTAHVKAETDMNVIVSRDPLGHCMEYMGLYRLRWGEVRLTGEQIAEIHDAYMKSPLKDAHSDIRDIVYRGRTSALCGFVEYLKLDRNPLSKFTTLDPMLATPCRRFKVSEEVFHALSTSKELPSRALSFPLFDQHSLERGERHSVSDLDIFWRRPQRYHPSTEFIICSGLAADMFGVADIPQSGSSHQDATYRDWPVDQDVNIFTFQQGTDSKYMLYKGLYRIQSYAAARELTKREADWLDVARKSFKGRRAIVGVAPDAPEGTLPVLGCIRCVYKGSDDGLVEKLKGLGAHAG